MRCPTRREDTDTEIPIVRARLAGDRRVWRGVGFREWVESADANVVLVAREQVAAGVGAGSGGGGACRRVE